MPAPQTLLPWLLGATLGAAGILQGLHWRSATTGLPELEAQLSLAREENAMLKRENESLRSLAQGGGELAVPQEFIDRTEKDLGLRFLSSPVVHRLVGEELRDRIAAAIESRLGPSGIDDRQESYKLIGWLRPDDDLLAQLTAVGAANPLGWFDEVAGEGWLADRVDLKNIPDQAALVHVLARALLHQHFPPAPDYPGDDAARAREALHQGAAAGSVARFYAAHARTSGFLPMKENHEAEQLLASFPPFIQGLANFPATAGKVLADTRHVQGDDKFQAAFRNPPQTTRAILTPDGAVSPPLLDLPGTPEEPFLSETAGQLGLRLWLEPLDSGGAEIAAHWKNDRYVLFPDGEASSAILWDIELETAAAADKLEAVANVAALEKASGSPEKRHLRLTRLSPTRVRFLNVSEPVTAAMLGSK